MDETLDISHADRIAVERHRRIVVLDVGRRGLLGREPRRHRGSADQARNARQIEGLGDVEEIKEHNVSRPNLVHAFRILQGRTSSSTAGECPKDPTLPRAENY